MASEEIFEPRTVRIWPTVRSAPFALAFALANTVAFHGPLLSFVSARADLASAKGLAIAATVLLLPTVLSAIALLAAALITPALVKAMCMAILLCNAVALYFMQRYGVQLDASMMSNVLHTNWQEASALWHPTLLAYVGLFGAVPAWVVWRLPLEPSRRRVTVVCIIFIPLAAAAWLLAFSSQWLWIDQHARSLGARLLPWSYVVNASRAAVAQADGAREFERLPDVDAPVRLPNKRVVVLIIGESARASNLSYYGYPRNTNPWTAGSGVHVVHGARACATYTTAALVCLLSHMGEAATKRTMGEPLPAYLARQGVDVLWRTANFGEPALRIAGYERNADLSARCSAERGARGTVDPRCAEADWDGILLKGLGQRIAASTSDRIFVTLHLSGSHGPAYGRKYPPRFTTFTPTCDTVALNECEQATLVNSYDNSIAYTDHVLAELTGVLKAGGWESAWLYVSDHGESLGEGGLYLHGTACVDMQFSSRDHGRILIILLVVKVCRKASFQTAPSLRRVTNAHVVESPTTAPVRTPVMV